MNDIRDLYKMVVSLEDNYDENVMRLNDAFDIELNNTFVIESSISGFTEDGVLIEGDEQIIDLLEINDILVEDVEIEEGLRKGLATAGLASALALGGGAALDMTSAKNSPLGKELQAAAQAGDKVAAYHYKNLDFYMQEDPRTLINLKIAYVDDSEREDVKDYLAKKAKLDEAEYQGRDVKLNKPMAGDVKKFKVYVNSGKKTADGKIKAKKVNFGEKGTKIKKSNPERRKSFRARHKCDTAKDKTTARYWSCKAW